MARKIYVSRDTTGPDTQVEKYRIRLTPIDVFSRELADIASGEYVLRRNISRMPTIPTHPGTLREVSVNESRWWRN